MRQQRVQLSNSIPTQPIWQNVILAAEEALKGTERSRDASKSLALIIIIFEAKPNIVFEAMKPLH